MQTGHFPSCRIFFEKGKLLKPRSVSIRGEISGLFQSCEMALSFSNNTGRNIGAGLVLTLPCRATLLALRLRLGAREYLSKIVERMPIEGEEDSSALPVICFEEQAPGIHCANLGILGSGEALDAQIRWCFLSDFDNGGIRIAFPVEGIDSGCPITASLLLSGQAASLEMDTGSCPARITQQDSCHKRIELDCGPERGRDIGVFLKGAPPAFALVSQDAHESFMAASFAPFQENDSRAPVFIKILVDCSVSMEDILSAVRKGLLGILASLEPADHISYSRFGSDVVHLWKIPRPCIPESLAQAAEAIEATDADMGGTNLENALLSTVTFVRRTELVDLAPVLLLISDGQVCDMEKAVKAAIQSGHTIFALGVGEYPDAALLQEVAGRTGGICEIVADPQKIPHALQRLLKSMPRSPGLKASIEWPKPPIWECRMPQYLLSGKTSHFLAAFHDDWTALSKGALMSYAQDDELRQIATGAPELIAGDALMRCAHGMKLLQDHGSSRIIALAWQLLTSDTMLILKQGKDDFFPASKEDQAIIRNAPKWDARQLLPADEICLSRILSHASWLERQKGAGRAAD